MSGLLGHIDHLYEDPNLTLEDYVKIYRSITENREDFNVYEKVDGYNIFISYAARDKKARLLRNHGQIKSGGITIEELKEEFTSKKIQDGKKPVPPNVVRAYTELIGFFEKVVEVVFPSEQQKELVFGRDNYNNPQIFFNCELIDPSAPNIVKYSEKMIIVHKLGNIKIDSSQGAIEATDTDEVKQKLAELSAMFGRGQTNLGIAITDDKASKIHGVNKDTIEHELSQLRLEFKRYNLDMKDTLGKYFIRAIEEYLKSKKTNFDNRQVEFISKSILSVGFGSKYLKKPRLNDSFNNTNSFGSGEIKNYTNEEPAKEIFKKLKAPIEKIMFNCSSAILDKYESVYVSDNKQSAEDIISLVNKSINNINTSGTSAQKDSLRKNLDKLRLSGSSFSDIINNPVEGIVFSYKNHTYKITSSFGPVNQIVNMNKFEHKPLMENKSIEANGVKVLFAGAFKPPHKGHLEVIKNFFKIPELNKKNFTIEKVVVIMGSKARFSSDSREFPLEQSVKLFQLYLKAAGLEDLVELRITKRENPVKDVYDYISNENNDLDKAQPGDVILLGVSAKDRGYYSNLSKYVKDKPWQILFGTEYEIPSVFKNEVGREQDILSEYSASKFRDAISSNNIKEINSYLPEDILYSKEYLEMTYKILDVKSEVSSIKESSLISLIDKKLISVPKQNSKLNLSDLINRVNSIYSDKRNP
jgi:nicotinamide mononucleotide adenylyltransferase